MSRNRVEIHYCYPTSPMADKLGKAGFYVTVGVDTLVISPVFKTVHGAEGFCRNNLLSWEPHGLSGGRLFDAVKPVGEPTEAEHYRAMDVGGRPD